MRVLGFGVAFLDFRGGILCFRLFFCFYFWFYWHFWFAIFGIFCPATLERARQLYKKIEIVVFLDTLLIFEHLARQLWERPATLQKKRK